MLSCDGAVTGAALCRRHVACSTPNRSPSLRPFSPVQPRPSTHSHPRAAGLEDGLELRVVSRGAAPGGGGEVVLRVPMVKQLSPVKMEDEGESEGRRGGMVMKERGWVGRAVTSQGPGKRYRGLRWLLQ